MAELVYAFDLKSNGETRTGSSPVSATKIRIGRRHLGVFSCSFNPKSYLRSCLPARHITD